MQIILRYELKPHLKTIGNLPTLCFMKGIFIETTAFTARGGDSADEEKQLKQAITNELKKRGAK